MVFLHAREQTPRLTPEWGLGSGLPSRLRGIAEQPRRYASSCVPLPHRLYASVVSRLSPTDQRSRLCAEGRLLAAAVFLNGRKMVRQLLRTAGHALTLVIKVLLAKADHRV